MFIFADQLRADCLGCAGHYLLKTPNIDCLAEQGVRFTDCYTTSPLCVLARESIVNGLYPHNSNMWQNDASMGPEADTYMKALKGQGYRTCSIGKNHPYPIKDANLQDYTENFQAIYGAWGRTE